MAGKLSKILVDDDRLNRWQDHVIGVLNPVIARVSAVSALKWIAPALLNGWVDYGAPYHPTGYAVDSSGDVRVRLNVKSGTAPSDAFTLPSGLRPKAQISLPLAAWSGAVWTAGVVGVSSIGAVSVQSGNINGSFAYVVFRPEQ